MNTRNEKPILTAVPLILKLINVRCHRVYGILHYILLPCRKSAEPAEYRSRNIGIDNIPDKECSRCKYANHRLHGDNVIGQLYGGETVLFYGLEEGWDKIECNGIVGYIGPKFLQ